MMTKEMTELLTECNLQHMPSTNEVYAQFGYKTNVSDQPSDIQFSILRDIYPQIHTLIGSMQNDGVFEDGKKVREEIPFNSNARLGIITGTGELYKKPNGTHANCLEVTLENDAFTSSLECLRTIQYTQHCAASFVLYFGHQQNRWYCIHRYVDEVLRGQGIGKSMFAIIEEIMKSYGNQVGNEQSLCFISGGKLDASANQVGLALHLARAGFNLNGEESRTKMKKLLCNDADICIGEVSGFKNAGQYQGIMFSKKHVLQRYRKKYRARNINFENCDVLHAVRCLWQRNLFDLFNNAYGIGFSKTIPLTSSRAH